MKRFIDLFTPKEKRMLGVFCVILLVVLGFLVFFALPPKRSYSRALRSLRNKEQAVVNVESKKKQMRDERDAWNEALLDMEMLREQYFYQQQETGKMRMDLQLIFTEARIHASRLNFFYADLHDETVMKVNVTFNFRGTYDALKRFLHSMEKFPKFLFIEKIDFLDINPERGILTLKIHVAGYHAT